MRASALPAVAANQAPRCEVPPRPGTASTGRTPAAGPASPERFGSEAVDRVLEGLRTTGRDALVAAMSDDGFRTEVPAQPELAGLRSLPLPPGRVTMVDLVAPADRLSVVKAWESARRTGMAMVPVRLAGDAGQQWTMIFLDARHRAGTWLGLLVPGSGQGGPTANGLPLPPPVTPRTAALRKNMFAVITGVDERAPLLLGWQEDQMVGVRSVEFLHPDDQDRAISSWLGMLADKSPQRYRVRHRRSDGSWLWVECENTYIDHPDPDQVTVLTQLSDISDEMLAYEALGRREQMVRRLAEAVPLALAYVAPNGATTYANGRGAQVLGLVGQVGILSPANAAIGTTGRHALRRALESVLSSGATEELELALHSPEGGARQCKFTIVNLPDPEGNPGALVCAEDVTESARLRQELEYKATYDALTRCHNREATMTALEQAVASGPGPSAVIFVDVDRFKTVNDRLGHAAGDALLKVVAQRLADCVRAGDIVGRLGGDEFLVVCRTVTEEAEVVRIAERIELALSAPVQLVGATVSARASIGVSWAQPGMSADALVASADAAMYVSKREGAGRPVVLPAGDDALSSDQDDGPRPSA